MKSVFALVVSMLVCATAAGAESRSVRPLGTLNIEAFDRGLQRSATFRALVAALERRDLIVHITTSRDLPLSLTGMTRFVADRSGTRYIRIELAASLSPSVRVSVLGHELQHALEIADSGARTMEAVLAFYQAGGRKAATISDGWETTAAEVTERRVWVEINTRGQQPVRALD